MAHPSTPGEQMTEGDATFCIYSATSGPNFEFSFAVLTMYPSRAILDESTSFYDLTEVDGVAERAALSIPNQQIAVSDGDLYMKVSYRAGRICDDIIDSESRKAACLEEMRVGLLALADVCWRPRGTSGAFARPGVHRGRAPWVGSSACPTPAASTGI